MIKFKVVDVRRLPSADPRRMGKYDRLVMLELGPNLRDTVTVADEEFTEAKVKTAVEALMKERGAWVGREFEV
jgi:hypothetical protein